MKLHCAIAKFLSQERDHDPVFGLMGDANLAYLGDFVEREHGNYIPAATESGAVLMAYGYARATRGLGVATVTHGPAVTNTLTAVTEAVRAGTPLVLLTGDTPDVNEFFQYVDIQGFARVAGARYERVKTPDTALATLCKAFTQARLDSRPVVVDIPLSMAGADVAYKEAAWPSFDAQRVAPSPEHVDEALGLVISAKRPLLIAGYGSVLSGATESVLNLARLVDAPVMTSLLGRGQFLGQPENLGIFGTMATSAGTNYIVEADVVLAFGASLNNWQTDTYQLLEGKRVIQVDTDPQALAKYGPVALGIVGDARTAADALVARLHEIDHEPSRPSYLDAIAADESRERRDAFQPTTGGGYVDARQAALQIDRAVPSEARQLTDVGRFTVSVWPHINPEPGCLDYPGYFGSIGLGLPSAVGAAAAQRRVPTVVWAGDGGTMESIAEITTAVRQSLPLIMVVINDHCYGAEYMKLPAAGSKSENAFMTWPSFAQAARGLGANSMLVSTAEELKAAVARIESLCAEARQGGNPGPLVIEVLADPHAMANQATVP